MCVGEQQASESSPTHSGTRTELGPLAGVLPQLSPSLHRSEVGKRNSNNKEGDLDTQGTTVFMPSGTPSSAPSHPQGRGGYSRGGARGTAGSAPAPSQTDGGFFKKLVNGCFALCSHCVLSAKQQE